ncbi:hypothetical protein ABZV34_26480 [Streptomyces sp. NPDC005195]|uniref:hypothetical protein n=1 Tax=Streptomyces sp. NPDC005195 TaxID=3154561 RepID=UPI0033AD9FA6
MPYKLLVDRGTEKCRGAVGVDAVPCRGAGPARGWPPRFLGDARSAVASFTKARKALNPADNRTRGLFLSRAATAHIEQGDLEAGCTTAHEVLDLAENLQSARFDSHVTSMIQQLRPVAHSPYAQDVLERRAAMAAAGSRT